MKTRLLIYVALGLLIPYIIISYFIYHYRSTSTTTLEPGLSDLLGSTLTHELIQLNNWMRTSGSSSYSKFNFKVENVDCAKLFQGNSTENSKNWTALAEKERYNIVIGEFVEQSRSNPQYCEIFRKERRYVTEPLTQEEADFPIAYGILLYKDVELFERLLRAIYRPQNYYCVHVDQSSHQIVHDAVRAIVKCFTNVFVPSRIINVQHAEYTTLEADLLCMRELLAYKKWKYFINLTGQEFPLQTSIAIVRILKALNGSNSIEGSIRRRNNGRLKNRQLLTVNATLSKGSVHITASRAYVDFIFNNETARKFLAWVKSTEVPDETFFTSLNHSPQLGVPGAYTGVPESFTKEYPYITRFKNWKGNAPNSYPCAGYYVRTICIFGVGDLPQLADRPELFANKFFIDHQPTAYACMEELLENRTKDELTGRLVFNESMYRELSFVKQHI